MPDTSSSDNNSTPHLPTPSGDHIQAEKYITQLISLIEAEKLDVSHTDLAKFDPSTLQDHFHLELKEYQVEISHSKHPESGKDSYIILFTNIKNQMNGSCEKIILAYMHLANNQFIRFKETCLRQIEKKRKAEQERRLKEALAPIDQAFSELDQSPQLTNNTHQSHHQIPAIS